MICHTYHIFSIIQLITLTNLGSGFQHNKNCVKYILYSLKVLNSRNKNSKYIYLVFSDYDTWEIDCILFKFDRMVQIIAQLVLQVYWYTSLLFKTTCVKNINFPIICWSLNVIYVSMRYICICFYLMKCIILYYIIV